ncbi:MAG: endonuclease VIII [Eubacteriaceae bacterium]|nr:endonuclease VIII [Eubacteriaceae bacterium]
MIELPEARTLARQLGEVLHGKSVVDVSGAFEGKFSFYSGDLEFYKDKLVGGAFSEPEKRNFYVELPIGNQLLLFRDGVNIRYFEPGAKLPKASKLSLHFDDGSTIVCTVSMYGFLGLQEAGKEIENEYYGLEVSGIGALDEKFTLGHLAGLAEAPGSPKLSMKAFLATGQRILGIGNGVLQDILFNAGIRPRRKVSELGDGQLPVLYNSIISTLEEMARLGGRDTEKDLHGNYGGYATIMSSKGYKNGCPKCGGGITKEAYMGGSVYYCPVCQE